MTSNILPALQHLAVPIKTLKTYKGNPRRGEVDRIAESLKELGQHRPLVVDKKNSIIVGNHTYLACLHLGWDEVAVIVAPDNAKTAAARLLADNRLGDLGGYDDQSLLEMILQVSDDEVLFAATGYDEQFIKELNQALNPRGMVTPDAVPEPQGPTVSVRGDIWLCGEHRVGCLDATSLTDIEALMDGEKAHMVWTDPPYGVEYTGGHQAKEARSGIEGDGDATLYAASLPVMMAVTQDKAAFYLWFAGSEGEAVYDAVASVNLKVRSQIIWNKLNPHYGAFMSQYMQRHEPCLYMHKAGKAPYWFGPTNEVSVWDVEQPSRNELHPTQKPIELASRAIENSSKVGNRVLDPFGGSGTSLIAAEKTGRHSRICDIDPKYTDTILLRWSIITGEKPILERTGEPHDFGDGT